MAKYDFKSSLKQRGSAANSERPNARCSRLLARAFASGMRRAAASGA